LDGDHFNVGGNAVLTAEVEHFLGLGDAADERAGQAASAEDQSERRDGERLLGSTDEGQIAARNQQNEVSRDIVVGGDAIEDEVKRTGMLRERGRITRNDDLIGTQSLGVFDFLRGGREDDGMGTESVGEFDAHVAEATKADDADLLPLPDLPMPHGGVGGDPGTEERSGTGEIEIGRHAKHEAFVDDDAVRIAAVGHGGGAVAVGRVVGERGGRRELFKADLALRTIGIAIDEATDRGDIAGLKGRDRRSDLGHPADDFMAGDAGIDGRDRMLPFVPHLVQIRMADATEENLDLDVVIGRCSTGNFGQSQKGSRGCRRVGF
jgi:hypothetical protein